MVLLGACAAPAVRFDRVAAEQGCARTLQHGRGFDHVVYQCRPFDMISTLHVYLEGDGTPWINHTRIAEDPTPAEPVALALMGEDPAPALLLGRPCYHGLSQSGGCSPADWTDRRYSEEVVASMAAALEALIRQHRARSVTLIGYSGGGTLAMLIAARVSQVQQVVTLAANLDVGAWAKYHDYSALTGSLDPAQLPALPASVRQFHLLGGKDVNVPPWMAEPVIRRQPNAKWQVLAGVDHACCWAKIWPEVLKQLPAP